MNSNKNRLGVVGAFEPAQECEGSISAEAITALQENFGLVRKAVNLAAGSDRHVNDLSGKISRSIMASRARFGTYSEWSDSLQDAAAGFLASYDRYDPDKGALSTYMIPNMLSAVARGIQGTGVGVRTPKHMHTQLQFDELAFTDAAYRPETEGYGFDEESDGYGNCWLPKDDIGLTPMYDRSDSAAVDAFENIDDLLSLKELVNNKTAKLPERTKAVLYHAFYSGEEMTYREIGELLGISKQRVKQIIDNGLAALKDALEHPQLETEPAVSDANKAALKSLAEAKLKAGGTVIDSVVHSGIKPETRKRIAELARQKLASDE